MPDGDAIGDTAAVAIVGFVSARYVNGRLQPAGFMESSLVL